MGKFDPKKEDLNKRKEQLEHGIHGSSPNETTPGLVAFVQGINSDYQAAVKANAAKADAPTTKEKQTAYEDLANKVLHPIQAQKGKNLLPTLTIGKENATTKIIGITGDKSGIVLAAGIKGGKSTDVVILAANGHYYRSQTTDNGASYVADTSKELVMKEGKLIDKPVVPPPTVKNLETFGGNGSVKLSNNEVTEANLPGGFQLRQGDNQQWTITKPGSPPSINRLSSKPEYDQKQKTLSYTLENGQNIKWQENANGSTAVFNVTDSNHLTDVYTKTGGVHWSFAYDSSNAAAQGCPTTVTIERSPTRSSVYTFEKMDGNIPTYYIDGNQFSNDWHIYTDTQGGTYNLTIERTKNLQRDSRTIDAGTGED